MCINANGSYLPSYIIYKGRNLRDSWTKNGPLDCRYNVSDSGWMEIANFIDWFKTLFIPYVQNIEGPKLLIYDGHSSHISVEVCEAAVLNDIHILVLPAHSSHIYQPLDVCVYKPIKTTWKNILSEWYFGGNGSVSKEVFPSLFNKVISVVKRSNAVSGFEATGIYPFDPSKTIKKVKEKAFLSPLLNSPSVLPSLRLDDDGDEDEDENEEDDEDDDDEDNNDENDDAKESDVSLIVVSKEPEKLTDINNNRIALSNITNINNNQVSSNSC